MSVLPLLCILLIYTTEAPVLSGLFQIKENSNINHYGKFGWSASLHDVKILDVVNVGIIFPSSRHVDATAIYWGFDTAFYLNISFVYAYALGPLPTTGRGYVKLNCNEATYKMAFSGTSIIPTLSCKWSFTDMIIDGLSVGKMKDHMLQSFTQDERIQQKIYSKFTEVLSKYYEYDYREKQGYIDFSKAHTRM